MKNLKNAKYYMPDYPRTPHLPGSKASRDDLTASKSEHQILAHSDLIEVTEKVDGASIRMGILDGHPLIGNRNHILDKSYSSTKLRNASKMQFASIWNWWYDHSDCFKALAECGPYSIYADWMYMTHGLVYDQLESLVIAYDIFDYEKQFFISPKISREVLIACGFTVAPLVHYGRITSFEQIQNWANERSVFSLDEAREGLYFKVSDGIKVTDRFKYVRSDFEQGKFLEQTSIRRNSLK